MFGLFQRNTSLVDSTLLENAVDNHSHILFGLDDGVKTLEDSLAILAWLEERGVKKVWFTPHVMEDVPNTTEAILARYAELRAAYKGGLTLDIAAEYMIDNLFEERLAARDLLVHGGRMVLVETSTWAPPIDLWGTLERMIAAGYHPLLAHPERYRYMQKRDYDRLYEMGILLQMNLPSILGAYGAPAQMKAEDLLKKGWYCMAGSDCHRFRAIREQYTAKVLNKTVVRQMASIMAGLPEE